MIADDYRIGCRDGDDDVIARFDRATVDHILTDLLAVHADTGPRTDPMPGEFAVAGFDRDALVLSWKYDDAQHTHLVEIDRVYLPLAVVHQRDVADRHAHLNRAAFDLLKA